MLVTQVDCCCCCMAQKQPGERKLNLGGCKTYAASCHLSVPVLRCQRHSWEPWARTQWLGLAPLLSTENCWPLSKYWHKVKIIIFQYDKLFTMLVQVLWVKWECGQSVQLSVQPSVQPGIYTCNLGANQLHFFKSINTGWLQQSEAQRSSGIDTDIELRFLLKS